MKIPALFRRKRTPAGLTWQEFVGLPAEALLTQEKLAKLLGMSLSWVKKQPIPKVRLGHCTVRYRAGTVRQYLRSHLETI